MMSVNGCRSCYKETTNNETDALSALFPAQLAVLTCVKTHSEFEDIDLIIDCTEVFIEKPSDPIAKFPRLLFQTYLLPGQIGSTTA